MRHIFTIEMLIYQSKANFDLKISFGKITHMFELEIWKMLVRGLSGNQNSTVNFCPRFACYWNLNSIFRLTVILNLDLLFF